MKLRTAFISSTGNLEKERKTILDALLMQDIFPFCMEKFAVDSHVGFEQIKALINNSDFFFLLLGTRYGSVDENTGISYTEMEFDYVIENLEKTKTQVLAFLLPSAKKMLDNKNLSDDELRELYSPQTPEDTRKQISFIEKVKMPVYVKNKNDISQRVVQFIQLNRELTKGWFRGIALSDFGIEENKEYYHIHITEGDDTYLRIGSMNFSIDSTAVFPEIHIEAKNYKAKYNPKEKTLEKVMNDMSNWEGRYSCYSNNKIKGVYTASRRTSDTTHGQQIEKGERKGIHTFTFEKDELYCMRGVSQDAYPKDNIYKGLKSCDIFVFDSKEKRLEYLLKECSEVLQNNLKES